MLIFTDKSRKHNTIHLIVLLTFKHEHYTIEICFLILEEIMKTILISGEPCVIEGFLHAAGNVEELEVLRTFQEENEALDMVSRQEVDLAVIDLEMQKVNGADIGWELKKRNPDIQLIYLTRQQRSLMDLITLPPVAVLEMPFQEGEIEYVVESAYLLSKRKRKRIYARTFGHFDVFVDGRPIMFKSAKAKEFLAFLIDRRGGTVSTDQMINVLWEDRPNDESTQNLCCKLVKTLQRELRAAGAEEMLVVARGSRSINVETFQCDMYEMLDGNQKIRSQYMGEYLVDYSWSEGQTAFLDRFLHE